MHNARRQNETGRTTSTDSLFGLALAGAFLGAVFGPVAEAAFEGGQAASAIYTDRPAPRPSPFGL